MADRYDPLVAMCRGSACRKRSEHGAVKARLAELGDVESFGCVGICAGPVVVVAPSDGTPLVVERVRSPKLQRGVEQLIVEGAVTKPVRKRLVGGKKSKRAIRKAVG